MNLDYNVHRQWGATEQGAPGPRPSRFEVINIEPTIALGRFKFVILGQHTCTLNRRSWEALQLKYEQPGFFKRKRM